MSLLNSKENIVEDKKTKEERVREFIKILKVTEASIEPFKEHLKDVKKDYIDNMYLDKKEMKNLVRAYRLLKDEEFDIESLVEMFSKVKAEL